MTAYTECQIEEKGRRTGKHEKTRWFDTWSKTLKVLFFYGIFRRGSETKSTISNLALTL